jgi:hypothetical protein
MKKLLLDECVPQGLRHSIEGFDVYSVTYMQWSGIKNGKLLQLAVENNFEVFLTTDKNLQYQQNMDKHDIAIVILSVVRLDLETTELLLPKFHETAASGFEKNKIYIIE